MEFDKPQREALSKLKSGSVLVGGTGSGKSRTALAYFFVKECGGSIEIVDLPDSKYSPMTSPKDLYIITTAAKRDKKEWELEMNPFLLSTDKDRCINHISITIDSWNNIAKYIDVENAFFIFDEQRVVGSGAWSKSFIKITKKNNWLLLTATPGDVWSDYIPVFIANGFYKNRTQFCIRHIVFSRYTSYPKIEKYLEVEHLEKLKRSIQVEMDVKRSTQSFRVNLLTEYDAEKYNTIVKDRWNIFEDCPLENASQYMSCIRRVVNEDPSKLEKLRSVCKDHKRLIIFYNFDYELLMLRQFGSEEDIEVAEWNGHNHDRVPESERWLYLVQYNAGAEGWNCITTNAMVFFSLSYSYRMTHQAAGRINRRNTPFTELYYYFLYSNAGIDKAILKALREKKDFNERKFYENMTSQNLQSLL